MLVGRSRNNSRPKSRATSKLASKGKEFERLCVQARKMVDPGRYSQRHTALTLSERVRKSGLSSANAGACPGPSGSIVYELPLCAIVEPLSRPYVLKANVLRAWSSLKPR